MAGIPTKWYDVRRNMDRIPEFADPKRYLCSTANCAGVLLLGWKIGLDPDIERFAYPSLYEAFLTHSQEAI